MKTLTVVFLSALFLFISYSQDNKDGPFKYPLERDLPPNVQPYPGPFNSSPVPTIFFNINISQQSAPQNEPSVAISRKNPNRVVSAWRDFRYGIDPVANRRVGYSYSTNGGLTWSPSQILDSTLLPGGLVRNSDPVVTVDTAGNFIISVIALTGTNGNTTLAVYRSTDGGMTFPNAFIAATGFSEDKQWLATDYTLSSPFAGNTYISWTRFAGATGIKCTKSNDGGITWSTPVAISDATSSVQGSCICVAKNGNVYVTWLGFSSTGNVMFDKSTNGGTSFGTDVIAASGNFPSGLPNNVNSFPTIAVDNSTGPNAGTIYIAFADNRNSDCDIFITKSTNNGANWSSPQRINNDPLNNGKIQYWPCIGVNENGNIAILFMDTRNTPNNTIIEAWIARSNNGGATFSNELISNEQSPTNIPGTNVRFGDYADIDYVGINVVPVWTDERNGGFNMDIFTAEISEFIGVENQQNSVPVDYTLNQNYPNPFNPSTVISFGLPKSAYITLKVFDLLGKEVRELVKGDLEKGFHSYRFDGSNLTSGVYFYTLTTGDYTETKKMLMVK